MTAITAEESRALLERLVGYTHGPLHAMKFCGEIVVYPDNLSLPVTAVCSGLEASETERRPDDEALANACLYAAAPDLVTHLRAALDREATERERAKIAVVDKFKMRDERDKAKIVASNYGNFSHDARKRAEKAEAERDALRAQVEAAERMAETMRAAFRIDGADEPRRTFLGRVQAALAAWDASKESTE